ncbi:MULTISPECIES: alpha/beta hydrolase family protein [Sphingobacterium]|uniref:alpha/beta hydrolase family protein n=1 Tax=Sphingobacterium TaxID=28453 RepID=UPI00257B4F5D|nr:MULTISPECIES: alpha/beta hydrolase [Sphingobacterium]
MKKLLILISILFFQTTFAQKKVEDFGYVHHQINFRSDKVDFIVKSKKGEERQKKPILIFIQGSLATPLIKYSDTGIHYPPFPFNAEILTDAFHLIAINKPGVPLIINKSKLSKNGESINSDTKLPPEEYTEHANLDFYVERNNKIIEYLVDQPWVDGNKVVVAGHSEGSSIAVKIAVTNTHITHLIYSGGTPYYSRILSMIAQDRQIENEKESWVEKDFEYWKTVNEEPFDISREHGYDTNKSTYSFSNSLNNDFRRLTIPVLISYGTKDTACPYNDLLRVEMIQENKTNIDFKSYFNRGHNYFEISENGETNYENFGWDMVGRDWLLWLNGK